MIHNILSKSLKTKKNMGQMVERKTNSGEENEAPLKEAYI